MKTNNIITPVILAGGSGTRLWPLSRKEKPKQFLKIFNNYSLFQLTIIRCIDNIFSKPIIIVGEDHRFIVAEQLKEIGIKNPTIILEPKPKNTTAAITIAAKYAISTKNSNNLLILPSDHYIKNNKDFIKVIKLASKSPLKNKLICFGIKPSGPETKYGYIVPNASEKKLIKNIIKFEEKPSLIKAKNLIKTDALWNSGMFLFSPISITNEIDKYVPKISQHIKKSMDYSHKDMDFIRLNDKFFNKVKNISIDYAVLEKTNNAYVLPTSLEWSDLGTYESLWNATKKDKNNNVIKGDVITNNVKDSFIHSDSKLVTASNLNKINIIATEDAILVSNINEFNEIKNIVKILNKNNRNELIEHSLTLRPWGSYQNINSTKSYKIKKLTVMPGKKLSLQRHKKRSEHWIVIEGTATVTKGNNTFTLNKNESTFISIKEKHRLENKTKKPLIIIEVQTGTYFGEDDIERFEDMYGRIK